MPHTDKILTCCYCGTRAALGRVPKSDGVSTLACNACGAPLKLQKPKCEPKRRKPKQAATGPATIPVPKPAKYKSKKIKTKKVKRRKSLFTKVLDEAWDVIEDIFD